MNAKSGWGLIRLFVFTVCLFWMWPAEGAAQASSGGGALLPLPTDVTSDIDAILDAATIEEAIVATRRVLDRAGVAISDAPTSATTAGAALAISTDELAVIARDAQSRSATRVTFAEFAETLSAVALLPPNDGLIKQLESASEPKTDGPVTLKLNGAAARMATFLSRWVNLASERYDPANAELTAVTVAPLYMAALAARRIEPMELRQPFSPSRLRLGSLEVTLIVAGMRANLRYAAGAASPSARAELMKADAFAPQRQSLAVQPPACIVFQQLLDAHIPLLTDSTSVGVGQGIQSVVEGFVGELLGTEANVTKAISPLFNALGVVFRVHAMILLYSNAEVRLVATPHAVHKPIGANDQVSMHLEAGIPDALWERAKNDREASPYLTELKACAKVLGVPVLSDLVDVGEATRSWRASWDIPRGSPEHAYLGADQFFRPGDVSSRHERPLRRKNDHAGEDVVLVDILPEKQSDHPGIEVHRDVVVCAEVRTNPPPSFQTLLQAGLAGTSLGGASQLAAVLGDIVANWVQFSNTLDACDTIDVSFHVPQPGVWHGTIVVNTEVQQSIRSSVATDLGARGKDVVTSSDRTTVDVTDEFYVAGNETIAGLPFVMLDVHQFTHGLAVFEAESHRPNGWSGTGCHFSIDTVSRHSGSWSFDSEGQAFLQLNANGDYILSFWAEIKNASEVTAPGTDVTMATILPGGASNCADRSSGTRNTVKFPYPLVATVSTTLAVGKLDPLNPGNSITGTLSTPNDDNSTTTITWDLTHDDGPIRLPER